MKKHVIKLTFSLSLIVLSYNSWCQQLQANPAYATRRNMAMDLINDGMLLLHSRSDVADLESYAFLQEPSFYYFTGLASSLGAILVIDGKARKTALFIPKRSGIYKVDSISSNFLLVDTVRYLDEFANFVNNRLSADADLILYTNESFPGPEKDQPMQPPLSQNAQWLLMLKQNWPHAKYRSAFDKISTLRLIKSPEEIALIRKAGYTSVEALLAGLASVKPGKTQREIEAVVVSACINKGANGPSQWPLVKTGPNAIAPSSRFRVAYDGFNREMKTGELGVMFAACECSHYSGGVSRSFPAGGKFNSGQREAWDLFIKGYKAALNTVKDGSNTERMIRAFVEEVQKNAADLKTAYAKKASIEMTSERLLTLWKDHAFTSVGIESFEGYVTELKAGMVFRFYPIVFYPGGEGLYNSDIILVTKDGCEILTAGAPYTAKEIEKVMGNKK